jgi:uncharacterized iron-regulated membrane protein
MRAFWTLLHRYAGLLTAAFLFISGVTGAVISWDHELDDLLNPHLMEAKTAGTPQASLALAAQVEARYPNARVSFIPLHAEPGESIAFGIDGKVDAKSGVLVEPAFNQVFVDPFTGAELGKWGIDRWGIWLMGGIAMIWVFDCFVGFYLTLPVRRRSITAPGKSWWRRWQPAWKVRWQGGGTKLNFDLHRAFSLWTWALLFILAFTAFSLNLYREVFYPLMTTVSQVSPSPFDTRTPTDKHHPIEARIGYADIIQRASAEARQRQWTEPAGSVFYSQDYGVYGVSFFKPGDDHGAGGVGPAVLYYGSVDGRLLGDRQPWKGTAADIFVQAQFPLHSGRILGLPGRILISIMGIVVAMLSVTGVIIWWRKRASRASVARKLQTEVQALRA